MIDTIKIFTMINEKTYNKIYNNSIVKSSFNKRDGQIYYEIVNDKLEGSYSSSLSVRVGCGVKYKFVNMYYIEVEGSYDKIMNGYNSHNGYYNLISIVKWLIGAVEVTYKINLPNYKHWFLQRIDIALVFNLENNENVRKYINNLALCGYPRRNIKHYQDQSIYCSGTTTTLKIYNKLLEFRKHDLKKLYSTTFNLINYINEIDGFIRFECEIKKKMLEGIYNKKYIRIQNIKYEDLKKIWSDEFMKLLNLFKIDMMIVKNKEDVKHRLILVYGHTKGIRLYSFYSLIVLDGESQVKQSMPKPSFYRNIKDLKDAGIDFSQRYTLTAADDTINFNPFTAQEVL